MSTRDQYQEKKDDTAISRAEYGTVTEHVPSGAVEPKTMGLSGKKKAVLIVGAVIAGTVVSSVFFDEDGKSVSTSLSIGPEQVNAEDLEGLPITEANEALEQAGIEQITVDHSELSEYSAVDEDNLNAWLVADDVRITGDNAYITAGYHPADIIASLDLEGQRWNDAETVLTEAGLENHVDYVVYTDTGDMVVESNWAVDYVDLVDEETARIVVTNEGMETLRENANDASETVRDSVSEWGDRLGEAWNESGEND